MELPMKMLQSDSGLLQLNVNSVVTNVPVENAKIQISYTGEPEKILEEITTDSSGQTEKITLPAPPVEYSMDPEQAEQPYSEYNIAVTAPGFDRVLLSGTELLSGETAIQQVQLLPSDREGEASETIVIPAHTLFAEYPSKIPEEEVKPLNETGEIVLSRVVVPEYVVVHNSTPSDTTATNYYVRYSDYIKNVASSEIYATWPDATIRANVLAIISFTLNRVFTEWYRNKGYDFTITNSTAYDQKWIYGRNIYESISRVVDEVFNDYLARPGVSQPIFTQYCDGQRVTCPNWLSQWGSKSLGDQGYSAIEILRYYYGSSIYVNTAVGVAGIPSSWPGYNLGLGASGDKVRQLQNQLNRIARAYPKIPTITADGLYGNATAQAVRTFQEIFGLPDNGIVDFPTWYKISQIYVGVSRIAEDA
jgi:peptidoglycan hydrolase-like protein with peptidoglycan-binding domain